MQRGETGGMKMPISGQIFAGINPVTLEPVARLWLQHRLPPKEDSRG
jgi:hypothetical protein